MDANLLVALIAPRPLLLQTGKTDKWSQLFWQAGFGRDGSAGGGGADSAHDGVFDAQWRARDGAGGLGCVRSVPENAFLMELSQR